MSLTRMNVFNMYFIGGITLITLVGVPLYVGHFGISASEILLVVFYVMATGLSITVGYHRLFAHVTYKTGSLVRFILLFFGAAAFQQSALVWASQHRDHHRYTDAEADPYNAKKGFFWAHMGWMFFGNYKFVYTNAGDLVDSKLVMHQARYYPLWSLTSGLVVPVLIGALTGHALGAFILAVCFRTVFVHHGTWCINSICHTFGKATYDSRSTARDNWLTAFITFGEGYHSFHHRFPNDCRNGIKWYHWDPSKWIITLFEKLGIAWNVKRASEFRILDARITAASQSAMDTLDKLSRNDRVKGLQERLHGQYELLKSNLALWERAAKDYYGHMSEGAKPQSQQLRQTFLDEMTRTRAAFLRIHEQWRVVVEHQIPGTARA